MNNPKKSFNLKWVLIVAIIGMIAAIFSNLKFDDNLVYFHTPGEVLAEPANFTKNTIRVGAMVKPGSVNWEPEKLQLAFVVTDMNGHELNVSHKGTPPDMFKENQGVIVEGRFQPDSSQIVASKLMVKHSEEYKKPGDHREMDKALIEKSLFKNQDY